MELGIFDFLAEHGAVHIGEIPGAAIFLVNLVEDTAIENTGHKHTYKSRNQRIEEEDTDFQSQVFRNRKGRSRGQHQREGTGGCRGNGAGISGHGIAGLAGKHAEHGGKHDVDHIAKNRDACDEAGQGNRILGAGFAQFLDNAVGNVVYAAGLIHEHTQHDAQAGDDADAAQGGAEFVGDHVGHIIQRHGAGNACAKGRDQQGHKGVEFQFDDAEQQYSYGYQENHH